MSQDTECFLLKWSIKLFLSIDSISPPSSCEKACGRKCQARCPCQNGGICRGKGICACPPGWTVSLALTSTFKSSVKVARLWISSCVIVQLALRRLDKQSLIFNTDLSVKTFWRQPVISGDDFGLSTNVKNSSWGFFVYGKKTCMRRNYCDPMREQAGRVTVSIVLCRGLISVCASSLFSPCWSAGCSLHGAMPGGTVRTELYRGVRLPQQGQMWPWNWTVSVCQRLHW